MSNIKDVAKAAGVSTSTVSRTINNSSSISKETKDRIFSIIKEMNYSPNSIAKALTNSKSYTVTLLVDVEDEKSFQNPFFYEIMHGIEKLVYHKEFSLIVANLNTTLKKQSVLEWLVKGKRTEGVILPSSILTSAIVEELKRDHVPFVSIGETTQLKESVSWVDVDNKKGAEIATYELLDKGYKNIAFLGYDHTKNFSNRRYEGYSNALTSSGIAVVPDLVIECGNTKDEGYTQMKKLLNEKNVPDAVICADNILSIGAIKAIQEAGLVIPENIGLISFDNQQIAELSYPTITTVHVDLYEMGYQAAKLLFEMIEDPETRDQGLLISTSLENRQTTK
ncbi:MAG: LacI family transcriptional regulator [Firmicutes bacterium]|nr:LacI family transcriptional regulator [Bacillota bacterium]